MWQLIAASAVLTNASTGESTNAIRGNLKCRDRENAPFGAAYRYAGWTLTSSDETRLSVVRYAAPNSRGTCNRIPLRRGCPFCESPRLGACSPASVYTGTSISLRPEPARIYARSRLQMQTLRRCSQSETAAEPVPASAAAHGVELYRRCSSLWPLDGCPVAAQLPKRPPPPPTALLASVGGIRGSQCLRWP